MSCKFGPDLLRDFDQAAAREWLETNGVGGWASSTLCGANTRRYHGLLVAASRTGSERSVLVSKLDETLIVGGVPYELGCNRYPGAIHPRGFESLTSFERGIFPISEYQAGAVRLRKTIVTPRGENTTIVLYELLEGTCTMRLRPFLAGRDYHSLLRRNDAYVPPRVFIDVPGARFDAAPDWYYNFTYDREIERGLDFTEDLYTPGVYEVELAKGDVLPVVLATEERERDPLAMIEEERARREALVTLSRADGEGSGGELVRDLTLAADQFIIDRGDLRTIIAGYHWFTDWGRDTMISLPGLCLVTRRFDDAKQILRRFLGSCSQGMLPNCFVEGRAEPEYNSVDAGLWLFIAVWQYLMHTADVAFVRNEAMPVLHDIIEWLDRGTRFNIHVDDADGLLYAGASGVQLTWMDARVGDWVVTPRRGKPVEVNALWYNALRIAGFDERAERVRQTFADTFWNEAAGCCFDVVDAAVRDASIRPNQIFAVSLPFPLFEGQRAASIVRVCEEKLLTPVGLRTLAPDDPRYRPRLTGPVPERDGAYHQGTVWPWLLGPYVDAVRRVGGKVPDVMESMRKHLCEAGVGTISEVFDGDPPHTPRGCIAQAWSVGEVLRVLSPS